MVFLCSLLCILGQSAADGPLTPLLYFTTPFQLDVIVSTADPGIRMRRSKGTGSFTFGLFEIVNEDLSCPSHRQPPSFFFVVTQHFECISETVAGEMKSASTKVGKKKEKVDFGSANKRPHETRDKG